MSTDLVTAERWLAGAAEGFCEATDFHDRGDCDFGNKGNIAISNGLTSLTDVVAACLNACRSCHRCNYVSVSREWKDLLMVWSVQPVGTANVPKCVSDQSRPGRSRQQKR